MLSDHNRQFRSSLQEHQPNHYTFGRSAYCFNNASINQENFQQNVNMTMNHNLSTMSTNGGPGNAFGTMVNSVPLSLSTVEATLNQHLCRGNGGIYQQNQNSTLMMPRSFSNSLAVDVNNWPTQRCNRKDKQSCGYGDFAEPSDDVSYTRNSNSQLNSLYQDIETCLYNHECRQGLKNGLSSHINNCNDITRSADIPLLLNREDLLPQHDTTSDGSNPYAIPREQRPNQTPVNVYTSNHQSQHRHQNKCKAHENYYQNVRPASTMDGDFNNAYSYHSSFVHTNDRGNVANGCANDVWFRESHQGQPAR